MYSGFDGTTGMMGGMGMMGGIFGMARMCCGCLCCAIVCCPIFIIIGFGMLVGSNSYSQYVSDYNAAGAKFNAWERNNMKQATGTLAASTVTFSGVESNSPVPGGATLPITADGVNPGIISVPVKSSSNVAIFPNTATITDYGTRSNTISIPSKKATYTVTQNIKCPGSRGDSSCSRSSMESKCRSQTCSGATWTSSSGCSAGSSCQYCRYTKSQASMCLVVTHSNSSGFSLSSTTSSCMYPFTSSTQPMKCSSSTTSSAIPVVFLHQLDPFIAYGRITTGKYSFGLTAAQQRSIGLVLIVLGALLGLCIFGVAIAIKKMFFKDDESKGKLYSSFGMSYTGQNGTLYNQAYYQQCQPAYQVAPGVGTGQPMLAMPAVAGSPVYGQPGYHQQQQPMMGSPMHQQPMMMQPQQPGYAQQNYAAQSSPVPGTYAQGGVQPGMSMM